MARKSKTLNNTTLIRAAIITLSIVALVALVALVVFIKHRQPLVLDDKYFVSDGSKLVLSNDSDGTINYADARKQYTVFFYSGQKIKGMKVFYEYDSTDSATTAKEKNAEIFKDEEIKSVEVKGKYIVVTSAPKAYTALTVDNIKNIIKRIEEDKSAENKAESDSAP